MTADRRAHLLELATALWLTRGYAGFSFADLARESGIRKASVHHHFATKADLGLALIRHSGEASAAFARSVADAPAEVALAGFFDAYRALLAHPDRLCPAGAIAADLAVLPPAVADAGRAYLAAQGTWLVHTLARGPWTMPAEALADTILGALQGGLQRSRAARDPERLTGVIDTLEAVLSSMED